MDAVNVRLALILEVACYLLVGQQHELLDELVGDIVLNKFKLHGMALLIQPDLHFGHLKVESSGGEAPFP